mmetsp:Transcript_22835/g.41943  ORF Transcript_22835/g.41943 Transcript_22835/m.41943 type:complete len:240 (+) Transcript_22835:80-799(+)
MRHMLNKPTPLSPLFNFPFSFSSAFYHCLHSNSTQYILFKSPSFLAANLPPNSLLSPLGGGGNLLGFLCPPCGRAVEFAVVVGGLGEAEREQREHQGQCHGVEAPPHVVHFGHEALHGALVPFALGRDLAGVHLAQKGLQLVGLIHRAVFVKHFLRHVHHHEPRQVPIHVELLHKVFPLHSVEMAKQKGVRQIPSHLPRHGPACRFPFRRHFNLRRLHGFCRRCLPRHDPACRFQRRRH